MFAQRILRCCSSMTGRRFISQSIKNFESKTSDAASKVSSSASKASSEIPVHAESVVGPTMIAPTNFDKWVLVWMKKFPKGQVPNRIRAEFLYQTKSRARVKAANYMTVGAILMCIAAAISGKRSARSGDTIQKRNMEWHKKVNEEHQSQIESQSKS